MDAVKKLANAMNPLHLGTGKTPTTLRIPTDDQLQSLCKKYTDAKQEHVFRSYDELTEHQKAELYNQASEIDPDQLGQVFQKATGKHGSDEPLKLEPLPEEASPSLLDASAEQIRGWREHGLNLIAQNKVAVVLMAGGQGTRLGSPDPKGCYDIGLKSRKSLFQLHAERILRLQELAGKEFAGPSSSIVIPWYIMTSGPTHQSTINFFRKHSYFGLREEDVVFFEQGILPCFSTDGKILMVSKSKVAVAPDGNGGIYRALITSNALADLRRRGVEHVHCYCVDNCLARVADPTFIGFAATKELSIATKVVRKRDPSESVGLVLLRNGKPDVVEYSEIDEATCKEMDGQGRLRFRAANIVNHYYSTRFLESIPDWCHTLPHHVARKKIAHVDGEGRNIKPGKPNAVKLEQFVFDVFPMIPLDKFGCMEVAREEEFSPLKNARGTGQDDPDTSRDAILAQGRRWLQQTGAIVTSEDDPDAGVEVSPLLSYGGEGLEFLAGREIRAPALLEERSSK